MKQSPIDHIFVENKVTPRGAKFRNFETPNALKLRLKCLYYLVRKFIYSEKFL